MMCPICGSGAAQIVYKRGKAKFNTKGAVAGALLTGGLGAMALGGMSGALKEKGYITCPHCGYDQFVKVNPQYVLERGKMERLEQPIVYPGLVSLGALRQRFGDAARSNSIPIRVRIDEVDCGRGGETASFPCLILEHPSHPTDYIKICICMDTNGSQCVFTPYALGKSTQLSMIFYNENAGNQKGVGLATAAAGLLSRNGKLVASGLGYEVGYRATTGITKSRNERQIDYAAAEFEKRWYSKVSGLVEAVLG